MQTVCLRKKKEQILSRFHPWIFSGAIYPPKENLTSGQQVKVVNQKGDTLAVGHYQDASIMVRILSWSNEPIDVSFYTKRLTFAWSLRNMLFEHKSTNAFRWVHGEGDGLPGLVVDYYANHVVVECHSHGMCRDAHLIVEAIERVVPTVDTIYVTVPNILRTDNFRPYYAKGQATSTLFQENSIQFEASWSKGQKTGFFLDQRDNRQLVGQLAADKKVLNLFAYSGGFSIYAAIHGAQYVHSVDSSEYACQLCQKHSELNDISTDLHKIECVDIMKSFHSSTMYDLVIVDPPAFAKSKSKRHKAVKAYKRLNEMALKYIAPGGFLLTFSCSQVVSPQLFFDTISSACIAQRKKAQVIKHLSQGADHPVSITHQESHYLKGLCMRVW